MKNSSVIALAAALIGLSGCIAFPPEDRPPGAEHGARPDHDQRDDRHDDNRDRRPDCDPRVSDCPRH